MDESIGYVAPAMAEPLTLADLAARIGEAVERVHEWRSMGLIGNEDQETFAPNDVQRAWIIQRLLRRGATLEAIARADRTQAFLDRCAQQIFDREAVPNTPLTEAIEGLGLQDTALAAALQRSELFPSGTLLDEDDLQALRGFKVAIDAGFPAEAMVQLMRVYADALWRVAETETRLFHFYVHEPLKAHDLSPSELAEASAALSARMVPLTEPAILYFHRRAWRQAVLDDAMLYLQDDKDALGTGLPGQMRTAVVFVDLSSFTSLADVMGDHAAAQVLERFSGVVREAANKSNGRVVKQIGDAFMLVFSDAKDAVACALEIDRQATSEAQFPAVRSGIHAGSVLYREGDYVGATVNLAARLAATAQPHQVAVTSAVREAVAELPGVTFESLGTRRLKGLPQEIDVFRARAARDSAPLARLVDPVCGMELDPTTVTARVTLEGREEVFCSPICLQRFVTAPESYKRPV
jgi:class 3 adenylate cyclase/YHS domain-containing protein